MEGLSTAESDVLAQIEGEAMFDQVQAWSTINSGSHNRTGLAQVAQLLADVFSALPGKLTLEDAQKGEAVKADGAIEPVEFGQNLHLVVRPDAPVQVLLTGHMDTVYGVDHPFQSLAWREPGVIGGPGVADMKGGISVMLAALRVIETAPDVSKLGYEVVINSDEELGSLGSAELIAAAARGKFAAFTYEPAILPDGTLAGARPGSGNFSIRFVGRSAHAGRNPQDGRNAIVAVADLTLRLAALRDPGLNVNPARIDGGSANNVVPDHAVLRINLRPGTPGDQESARAALDEIVAEVAQRHEVAITIHGGFGRPPKILDPASLRLFELVRDCGLALDQKISWRDSGGVCDGNNIAALGVPVVDTMGVRGGAIHSPDEYLIVDSLAERARLSALALIRIASGDHM